MQYRRKSIRPKKLHEQVAERLRAMILERHLLPGDKLPSERELQAMFDIGRPAVREALLLLERSGLVELRSGSPATVASANPENILREMRVAVEHFLADAQGVREIQAARRLLECGFARQAAKHRTESTLDKLRAALDLGRELLDDVVAFENVDLTFHFAIVEVSGNRVFEAVFRAMAQWLREQRTFSLSLPGQTDATLADHQAIYEAIAARDPEAAEEAMNSHLVHVEKMFWAAKEMAARRAHNAADGWQADMSGNYS